MLGLAYILFFNHPANPLGWLYGTLAILVLIAGAREDIELVLASRRRLPKLDMPARLLRAAA